MASRTVLTAKEVENAIKKISIEILNCTTEISKLLLIGIVTRGVYIAKRIQKIIEKQKGVKVPIGTLDITFYRDDVDSIAKQPKAHETNIPFDLTEKNVILVDDVLFTGRSIRSALDEIIDFGRPKSITLAVLVDRGHRELPIQADFIGKKIKTKYSDQIQVKLKEIDKVDKVVLRWGNAT
ncbi:MAG: bifunctional pyr operon transcriptional regulator/uracil phosphoribosyltransferase PyrR [Elusimicrobiota bacterium]|nr:bifunctional pyr operon transcriptional regulator/uracil phosphoribosyltransferase PyrR [Elusimicrobiota bacterium]